MENHCFNPTPSGFTSSLAISGMYTRNGDICVNKIWPYRAKYTLLSLFSEIRGC